MIEYKIESKDNLLIKKIVKLAKDSSYRNELGLAVIYGNHLVMEAIKYNILDSLVVLESSINKYREIFDKIHTTTPNILDKINLLDSDTDIVGVIKIASSKKVPKLYADKDYILLENVQDPGNLGTIMRVAKASGINSICLSKKCVDVYNPKVLRASQGLQFGLDIFTNTDFIDFIKHYSGTIIATTPHTTQSVYSLDLTKPIAWVFGNEGIGISSEILDKINIQAKIPMNGDVESLNIAMAATICVFEMARQRLC
jgi:TrmH family RNA methyltransferase